MISPPPAPPASPAPEPMQCSVPSTTSHPLAGNAVVSYPLHPAVEVPSKRTVQPSAGAAACSVAASFSAFFPFDPHDVASPRTRTHDKIIFIIS